MYNCCAQWKVVAKTELREENEGGAKRLLAFQKICVRNGVRFAASE
jgi:hypothetical protein